jgi:hypothetical protein
MSTVSKFIRIEQNIGTHEAPTWQTGPGAGRLEVWDTFSSEGADTKELLRVFHIAHTPAAKPRSRVIYLGQKFCVVRVSSANKLIGIEIFCRLTEI